MFGLFRKKKEIEPISTKIKETASPAPKPKRAVKQKRKNTNGKMTGSDVLNALNQMQKELDRLKIAVTGGVVGGSENDSDQIVAQAMNEINNRADSAQKNENEKVIEGVFEGQSMIGSDGQQYDVPANYASKSKLVEGDIMKLTINNMGAFVYKQIKPIDRIRKVGVLDQDPQTLQFFAVADGKKWKLLTASVTYFKGEAGNEIVFLIPSESGSRWAAVENIVKG
ncbi:hypothetical protein HQ571_06365 [Candidatus Kuenenbacteria bacterium]|nr:hypothetical protein [Candidatus Kuenenbacteria bacterium]